MKALKLGQQELKEELLQAVKSQNPVRGTATNVQFWNQSKAAKALQKPAAFFQRFRALVRGEALAGDGGSDEALAGDGGGDEALPGDGGGGRKDGEGSYATRVRCILRPLDNVHQASREEEAVVCSQMRPYVPNIVCAGAVPPKPPIPPVFEKKFLSEQRTKWENHLGRLKNQRKDARDTYELSVLQPTFMVGMRLAAQWKAEYTETTVTAAKSRLTKFPIEGDWTTPIKMRHATLRFAGNAATIGTLRPDFGLFVDGFAPSSFSALLVGDTDGKDSLGTVFKALTPNHKGKNLGYHQQVLNDCPRRVWQGTWVYSFLTNFEWLQFMRTKRGPEGEDEHEATEDVNMEHGWPFLWELVNGSPVQLGGVLPSTTPDTSFLESDDPHPMRINVVTIRCDCA